MKRRLLASLGLFLFAAVLALGLVGCGKNAPPPPPPPPPEEPPPPPPTEADLFRSATIGDLEVNLQEVYFDYDKSDLRADARDTLGKNADWLERSYNTAVVELEGHCDERGTEQYNLALGERRARAAMDYLVSLGVPSQRLQIVSFGEERPQCSSSNEDCWQRNRRAYSKIVSK